MSRPIEDYAVIGDTQTAALVSRAGSIDWLCLPRFDSGACFASLLGDERHGCWELAPAAAPRSVERRYREGTLILETDFEVDSGAVRITDCMPPRDTMPDVVRVVRGLRGSVDMRMRLIVRFDYGLVVPWAQRVDGPLRFVAGPDALSLRADVDTRGENLTTVAEFRVAAGDEIAFVLTWHPSHLPPPEPTDARGAVADTDAWWQGWAQSCNYDGRWPDTVMRSLITLKALTYAPTGGIVAAATTSLPEQIGGVRNWDYRYCWLRDATFTLYSLLAAGFEDEARDWRDWLLRAVAGAAADMQIMYGPAGERRLMEYELDWLPGYEGSRPVRVGNAAVTQFQLDVYGEVMDSMYQALRAGLPAQRAAWDLQLALMDFLESNWQSPDEGIWEVRGPRRHFTHSKVMAWVAADRAVSTVERFGESGPVDRWRALRAAIHDEVLKEGYNAERGAFTQYYGSSLLDASLLMMPLVGFLPATDDRVRSTIEVIERELCPDGFVERYHADPSVDGLPEGEGAFLACSFWLADCLAMLGRDRDAEKMFMRLLGVANDVGLLSEEYDPVAKRLLGNFPQAFSHVSLVNTAANLSRHRRRAGLRREDEDPTI